MIGLPIIRRIKYKEFDNEDLIQKSEMYSLPQTALNWKYSFFLALIMCILGIAMLVIVGRKSNV